MSDHYDTVYRHFARDLAAAVRRETYGEDIGQTSWLTADDFRRWLSWLALPADAVVLEVGCGSGGPALVLVRATGARLIGVDVSRPAVAAATTLAAAAGLSRRACFLRADGGVGLPFADASFDALFCIDALNHLPSRAAVFCEWRRVLRPGGRLLCTDPTVVTGLLSSDECSARSLNAPSYFSPPGEDERLLHAAGLRLLRVEDATEAAALVAGRRHAARERHQDALVAAEGPERFARGQRLYAAVATLARERRLSRFVFLARR
jgi:SAM-dependent methyltransferase